MKAKLLTLTLLCCSFISYSQYYQQYFDGADTVQWNSIEVIIDPDTNNIWQIGKPQKAIFDSASTLPNAIVTDTLSFYPDTNTSSFKLNWMTWSSYGISALQWKQKLDLDTGDFAIIEFSVDMGNTWQNVFNNPYVYNFYGFDTLNVDTMPNGNIALTYTDSTWKDIWLCFDYMWIMTNNYNIQVRYTIKTDSITSQNEGWMIDNMTSHITIIHTINEEKQADYMVIYPNPTTNGIINISTRKIDGPHIIENMQLINIEGKCVQQWNNVPTKFFIDIGSHASGMYYLKVKTNIQEQTFPIILNTK